MFININKKIATFCAVLLGFSLPISTGMDSTFLAILLITSLIGWNIQYIKLSINNSVTKAALILFGILFLGCFYGEISPSKSLNVLTKYDDLILVALLLPIFAEVKVRRYGQYAFMGAMLITLVLSYLIWLGVFQHTPLFTTRTPDNPVVFKLHITHGVLMGFAAFMFAIYAKFTLGKVRWFMVLATILALCNVLLMTQGRTGYIVVLSLFVYLIFDLLNKRKALIGLVLIIVASTAIYATSPKIQARMAIGVNEIENWQPMKGHDQESSMGTRLDYYTNTAKIIRKNPLLGVGTGGFENAYGKEITGTSVAPSNNPHNQFLLFWAQTGVAGLVAFLWLLATTWRTAIHLPTPAEKMLARGLIITIAAGCLFNSLLLDHTEGLFFSWLLGLLFAGLNSNKQS